MTTITDEEKVRRLYIMKRTEIDIIKLRGFNPANAHAIITDEKNNISFSPYNFSGFKTTPFPDFYKYCITNNVFLKRENYSSLYQKEDNSLLLVLYLDSPPNNLVTKDYMNVLYTFLRANYGIKDIILISPNGISSKILSQLHSEVLNINFTFFIDIDLAFNVLKHALAPISLLHYADTNKQEFEKNEELNRKELPILLKSDPISKYYGAKDSSVFVEVLCGTEMHNTVMYRLVKDISLKK